jgi:hypothetical protein
VLSEKKKHKIIIIGDRHGREGASSLIYNLGNEFEVQGIIKPGADIKAITNTVKEDIKLLMKNDIVVVLGGTGDMSRNEMSSGLNHLKDFYRKNYQTNIIQMCVPHRHDLPADSCVNKEIVTSNRKLGKLVKAFEHTALVKLDIDRESYTKHDLHLNHNGKELIARKMIPITMHILYKKTEEPISMTWKQKIIKKKLRGP